MYVYTLGYKYESGSDSEWLSYMYGYFEPRTTRPPGLVVSVANNGARGPGSIPEWAPNINCVFSSSF